MQFAERWIGSSMIVAGVLALAPALLLPSVMPTHRHYRHHHHHRAHLDLAPHGCAEARVPVPAPPPPAIDPAPADAYAPVFDRALPAVQRCLRGGATVQLLLTIAPDGHVKHVSPRPDRATPASECLTRAILPLRFPASPQGVVLRVPFSAP